MGSENSDDIDCKAMLHAARLLDVSCCTSCHDEMESAVVEFDGRQYEVCCNIRKAVTAMSLTPPVVVALRPAPDRKEG